MTRFLVFSVLAPDLPHVALPLSHFRKVATGVQEEVSPTTVCRRKEERDLHRAQLHVHRFGQYMPNTQQPIENPSGQYH